MALENKLIAGILRDEGGFRDAFREVLDEDLKMSIHEFCTSTGLSPSTIYKIMQDRREPNLRTVREIIRAVRKLENRPGGNFIAVIGHRVVLNQIEERIAASIEDAIVAAVHAERDGAIALVCAPIAAPTVEKILTIPVSIVIPQESVVRAIARAAEKTI